MDMKRIYLFKTILQEYIKTIIRPNPKFRIIVRSNLYVAQIFVGWWIFGIYADLSNHYDAPFVQLKFEHENIADAEMIIEKAKKAYMGKTYIVKEYE